MKILLTGASGFLGSHLVRSLTEHELTVIGRTEVTGVEKFICRTLAPDTVFRGCFHDVECIVHSAARVHIMKDEVSDPLTEYRKVNVKGTLNLARQAAGQGVQRFVFISSIKVNGEQTLSNRPFFADDAPNPKDAYGISKYEAEEGLKALAAETSMEVVIIRPVLVYGPGVKANFRSMMSWMNKGVPLPLGSIRNKRSMVALDNLVDLITTCIDHPAAANQTFLVSDGEDLSTTELLERTAQALGTTSRLLPFPARLLEWGAGVLGKRAVAQRLCGSLQVDIRHTCETLGWQPPVSVDQALKKTADTFLAGR